MVALSPNGPAPYTTAQSLTVVLDAYRDKGLGTPITTEVLARAGVGESIAPRTLNSMKVLGLLLDDGMPSEQFEALRTIRDDAEYRKRIQEWLRGVYADVLQYTDPSVDNASKIAAAFRTYEPAGRRPQMASLLLGLWRYAGLPVAEAPAIPSRSSNRPARAPASRKSPGRSSQNERPKGGAPVHQEVPPGLPPALLGLLQQIPTDGKGWTEERRKAFMAAFEAVLDYTVPAVQDYPVPQSDETEVSTS